MEKLSQYGGKPKKTKSKTGTKTKKTKKTKTSAKKGGNFLGSVGELIAPTGWGSFATAAALLAIDRADAAFRRKKGKKMSGGSKESTRAVELIADSKNSSYWKTKEGKERAKFISKQKEIKKIENKMEELSL